MKNYINIVFSFIILVVAFAAVYCSSTDFIYETYTRVITTTTEIVEEIDPRTFQNEDELLKNMVIDFFNIKSKNDHIIGWLNVPNVGYFPVMAYSDNQFYLNHNEYDKYHANGTIFMNTASEFSFSDMALVHGHRLRSGKLFGTLKQYKDKKFFQQNDLILVFDGEYFYYYKPFSVFLVEDGVEYIKQSGLPGEERTAYLESIYKRSTVKMEEGLTPNLEEQILYLQTCDYSFDNARLIVATYRVRTIKYDPEIHGVFNPE